MICYDFLDMLYEESKKIYVEDFVKDCERNNRKDILQAEALGVVLCRAMDSDGNEVGRFLVRALYAALEDANWDRPAIFFHEWVKKLEGGAVIGELAK